MNTRATAQHPRYDVTLSDGERTVGLMLVDGRGNNAPTNIKRVPYPRTSTKIQSGTGKYDDFELPYKSIVQENWIGGRAGSVFEDDTTRFLDSYRLWTEQEKQVCLSGQETYSSQYTSLDRTHIYRYLYEDMPGNVEFVKLMGDETYLARMFTAEDDFTTSRVGAIIKRVGTPGSLSISIYTNNDVSYDKPWNEIDSVVITTTTECLDNTSKLYFQELSVNLTGGDKYWIVLNQSTGSPSDNNHWEIAMNPDSGASETMESANGTSWSQAAYGLYYRVADDTPYKFRFFEYKRSIYAVEIQNSTDPRLYINGDRGNAYNNLADKSVLGDPSKSWTTDEWVGCVVLITKGAGSSDKKSWRTITSNDANHLTVDEDWDTTHTLLTEYVILGSNTWSLKHTFTHEVTDVCVAGDFVYFAQGELNPVVRYCERVNDADDEWTAFYADEDLSANKLCAINTPNGWEIWGSNDNHDRHGTCVWKAKVPVKYSTTSSLFNLESTIDDGRNVWDERYDSDVSVTTNDEGMAVTIVSGKRYLLCSKELQPIDITRGNKIGVYLKSNVQLEASDLQIRLDDTPFLGREYLPDSVLHYDSIALPTDVVKERAFHRPTSVMFYDNSETDASDKWKSNSNLCDGENTYVMKPSYASGDKYYVSYSERYSGIWVDIVTPNQTNRTLTIKYWNGIEWATISSVTDGTVDSGVCMAVSGMLKFACPDNWTLGCHYDQATYLASDRYHLEVSWSDALHADLEIGQFRCLGVGDEEYPESGQFVSLKNLYDSSYSVYNAVVQMRNHDSLYVRYSKRYDLIHIDIESGNSTNGTMTAKYWNGQEFADLVISDGTETGTAPNEKTLTQSGDITFTIPDDWAAGCPAYLSPYLADTDFIIKLMFHVTDSPYKEIDAVTINKIYVEDTLLNEVFTYTELDNLKDGQSDTYDYINLKTGDYLYAFFASKFNLMNWLISTGNSETADMNAEYFNGYQWAALTLTEDTTETGGVTLANSGYMKFVIPHDWQVVTINEVEGYAVRLYPSADLSEGVKITELYVENDDAITTITNPAILYAERWTYFQADISPSANPNPDERNIMSIGLYKVGSTGSEVTITIGFVELLTGSGEYFKLGNERVNSIEVYGDERTNPWIFTEEKIYEVQTENDNTVISLPLREISTLRSDINGNAHTVSDVYLVFNLDGFIQKYYQHNMDDISPSKDEGLPENRQGDPTCLLSYPGRIFLSIDANTDGYSTIMVRRSAGWHEIYRAPLGNRIHHMTIQVIPSLDTRLWISQENDLLWIPLPTGTWNPVQDSRFIYSNEGMLITCWITAGFLDIDKLWKSVKLYTEDLVEDEQYITCEYQEDYGLTENCTHWHAVEEVFDESPFKEVLLDNDYDVTAKRIRFRFKFHTNDNTKTPVMKAMIIECLLRFPVKNSFPLTFRLEDNPEDYTGKHDTSTRIEEQAAILDEWANTPTVLRMRCLFSPFDNKRVIIEPLSLKPVQLDSNEVLFEKHVAQATLLEV